MLMIPTSGLLKLADKIIPGDQSNWYTAPQQPSSSYINNLGYAAKQAAASQNAATQGLYQAQGPYNPSSPAYQGGQTSAAPNYSSGINSAFNNVAANFDAQQNDLDRTKNFNEGQINNQYASSLGDLNFQRDQANQGLDRSQAAVDYTRSNTLRELGTNIDSAMNSRLSTIGALGGGSSSAGYGLALALNGTESTNRGAALDQAGVQYGDINFQRKQAQDQYNQTTSNLDRWKSEQIAQITNDYLTQKGIIDRQRAGADAAKQTALAQNSLSLAQTAAAQLASVQANVSAIKANTSGASAYTQNAFNGIGYDPTAISGGDPSIQYNTASAATGDALPAIYSTGRKSYQYA